jgi:hypothetical protein
VEAQCVRERSRLPFAETAERGVGPASPDARSRFVIAREKLRKRAPKVMKSLMRVALRTNFHFSG